MAFAYFLGLFFLIITIPVLFLPELRSFYLHIHIRMFFHAEVIHRLCKRQL